MTERCKRNPCCADYLNCKEPPQFLPREGYEAYRRRIGREPKEAAMASEMPERIWAGPHEDFHKDANPRCGYWEDDQWPSTPTPYIRADLVDDAVKALEEAREKVEHWADVASRSDRTRYDTSDDLAKIDAALTRLKETT